MRTPWLLMLAGLLASVSGTAVTKFYVKPTLTSAGQYPGMDVSFVPTADLVAGDTINITVISNFPSQPWVRVFQGTSGTISVEDCSPSTPAVTLEAPASGIRNSVTVTLGGSSCLLEAGQAVYFHIPAFQWVQWNPNVGTVVWLQMTTSKDTSPSDPSAYAASSSFSLRSLSLSSNAASSSPDITIGFTTDHALHGGDIISVSSKDLYPLFQGSAVNAAFGKVGSNCTTSTATSSAPASPVQSRILIKLGPAGCVIPANTDTRFTIPNTFVAPLNASRTTPVEVVVDTSDGQWASGSFMIGNPAGSSGYSAVTWGGALPTTTVAGVEPKNVAITFTPTKSLSGDTTIKDTIYLSVLPNWFILDGVTPTVSVSSPTCPGGLSSAPFAGNFLTITLNAACNLTAATPVVLTLYTANQFEFTPAAGTVLTFGISTSQDTKQLYNQVGYTTVAECSTVPAYTPGYVSDIDSLSMTNRTYLASQIGVLSWYNDYNKSCTTDTEKTTFVKHSTPYGWPNFIDVSYPNTPELFVTVWGPMITTPMQAVLRSYPATDASLAALGIHPTPPSQMYLSWILAVERMTDFGALQEDGTFTFHVAAPGTAAVLFFETVGDVGVPLAAGYPYSNGEFGEIWSSPATAAVSSKKVSAFVGYVPAASPSPQEDESDDAWFGFLVFILFPLLCCSAILFFLWKRKPKMPPPPPVEPAPAVMYQQPYPTLTYPDVSYPKDLMSLPLSEIPPPPAIHNPVFTSSLLTGAVPAPSPAFYP